MIYSGPTGVSVGPVYPVIVNVTAGVGTASPMTLVQERWFLPLPRRKAGRLSEEK
jgi:hypothetical protein